MERLTAERLAEIEKRRNMACAALNEACQNKFRLRAEIPANPHSDHDLLISFSLDDIPYLISEVRRLSAVVDRLPVTADGVPITPDMLLWRADTRNPGKVYSVMRLTANVGTESVPSPWCPDYCYSKESEAVKAREAAAESAARREAGERRGGVGG